MGVRGRAVCGRPPAIAPRRSRGRESEGGLHPFTLSRLRVGRFPFSLDSDEAVHARSGDHPQLAYLGSKPSRSSRLSSARARTRSYPMRQHADFPAPASGDIRRAADGRFASLIHVPAASLRLCALAPLRFLLALPSSAHLKQLGVREQICHAAGAHTTSCSHGALWRTDQRARHPCSGFVCISPGYDVH